MLRIALIYIFVFMLTCFNCIAKDSHVYLEEGIKAYKEEADFDTAVSKLRKAIETGLKDKDDIVKAYLHLGFAYMGKGMPAKAEMEFGNAIKLQPSLKLYPEKHSNKIISSFNSIREQFVASLAVISNPGGAEVFISEEGSKLKRIGVTPLKLDSLLVGNYNITVKKSFYLPENTDIFLKQGKENRLEIDLKPGTAKLKILSDPPEAFVFSDADDPLGTTPLSVEIPLDGSMKIKMLKEGYLEKELEIKVSEDDISITGFDEIIKDESKEIKIELQKAPPPGSLRVTSEPTEAAVYLDGMNVGNTPLYLESISPGKRNLRVSYPGFASYVSKVEINSNQESVVEVLLGGKLIISSIPAEAQVFIDQEYKGIAPLETGRIPSGTHEVMFTKENYRDISKTAVLKDSQDMEITGRLIPIKGSVSISSQPSEANVYLDGEMIGKTPVFIYGIMVGKYNLKLEKYGYQDWKKQIEIEESKLWWNSIRLKPEMQ
ncbi:PEGA domain-containing protein [Candidatus Poribacteria bacterium]|nr:PEGA domain-containing protein [Candidatus Poribacteria bacterium]